MKLSAPWTAALEKPGKGREGETHGAEKDGGGEKRKRDGVKWRAMSSFDN